MESSRIKISEIKSNSYILKPNYHLNYGKLRISKAKINNAPFESLGVVASKVYTGGIFKRIFVEDLKFGMRYISAQHMMDINPLDVSKKISKKFTPRQDDMTLRKDQILVSCAGTIGNVRLINEMLDGTIGSQDIIRIISSESNLPFGYLYSYLSTATAYNYMQSFIYGSVVPRIDPTTLSRLPVFILSESKRNDIHQKIVQSYTYRNKAIELLNEAIELLESYLPDFVIPKIYSTKISDLQGGTKRLDATFSSHYLMEFYSKLQEKGYLLTSIKEASSKVFTPNIFKRIKTEKNENSVAYLGGAELLEIHPKFNSYLSKRTKNISDYILRRGWLAIQDSGSIQSMGYVSIVPSYLDGVAATNNLVRVIPNENLNNNFFIYAYLKTKQGNALIKSHSYGTGQVHIDNRTIENLKVPVIPEIFDIVTFKVQEYLKHIELGYTLEDETTSIIEKEISLWQK